MKKLKLFCIFIGFVSFLFAESNEIDINVKIDGVEQKSKMLLMSGKGYLKANDIAKFYGAEFIFDQNSKNVILKFQDKTIQKEGYILGENFYLPLIFILSKDFENISGYQTTWNYDQKELILKSLGAKKFSTNVSKKTIDIIVIDPGHGGKDPGAIAKNGVLEKNINLSFAKTLTNILRDKYNKNVILTRDTDVFIPLRQRAEIANKNNANIFVSVHANAARSNAARGFEIYLLSEKASDDEAYEVARFENAVVSYEDEQLDGGVNTILWSMVMNEFINESTEIGFFVNENVKKTLDTYPVKDVRQAGFAVLKGAKMPAILVELGYMTNLTDLTLITSQSFQNDLAEKIAQGLIEYEKSK